MSPDTCTAWPLNSDQSGHPGRRCGRGALRRAGRPWEDDAFTCRAARGTVPEGGSRTGDAHGMIRATQRHEIQAGHDSPGLR
jgi:hypothetical protein